MDFDKICNVKQVKKNIDINAWCEQVKNRITKYKQILDAHPEKKELYKGFRIFYGPYIEQPDVLLIGYNPGAGHDQEGEIWTAPSNFEYGMDWEGFILAKETKSVFSAAGLEDVFYYHSTKINCYFILTQNAYKLKSLKSFLDEQTDGNFSEESNRYVNELVCSMAPRVIVCEGKMAFDTFLSILNLPYSNVSWENKCAYITIGNGLTLVGYMRRYSNIVNKAYLSKLLATILEDRKKEQIEKINIVRSFFIAVYNKILDILPDDYLINLNLDKITAQHTEILSVNIKNYSKVRFSCEFDKIGANELYWGIQCGYEGCGEYLRERIRKNDKENELYKSIDSLKKDDDDWWLRWDYVDASCPNFIDYIQNNGGVEESARIFASQFGSIIHDWTPLLSLLKKSVLRRFIWISAIGL